MPARPPFANIGDHGQDDDQGVIRSGVAAASAVPAALSQAQDVADQLMPHIESYENDKLDRWKQSAVSGHPLNPGQFDDVTDIHTLD